MKAGDIVKYYYPESGEENLRFKVLEMNGDRAIVQLMDSGMSIPPQFNYLVEDLMSTEHEGKIPKSEAEAIETILQLLAAKDVSTMAKDEFLKGWYAIAYTFPGIHPDDLPEKITEKKNNPHLPGVLRDYCAKSGWPCLLVRIGEDAWRRYEAGELSDDEMYPVEAQKAAFS